LVNGRVVVDRAELRTADATELAANLRRTATRLTTWFSTDVGRSTLDKSPIREGKSTHVSEKRPDGSGAP
jgi:hypothetical protein